jgi:hypothetical protein
MREIEDPTERKLKAYTVYTLIFTSWYYDCVCVLSCAHGIYIVAHIYIYSLALPLRHWRIGATINLGVEQGFFLGGPMTISKGTRVVREDQTLNFTSFEGFICIIIGRYVSIFSS